jgi:hypothetical protein
MRAAHRRRRARTFELSAASDDRDEIPLPEHRVPCEQFAAKVGGLLVHLLETVGIFVQSLTSLGR